MSTVLGSGSKEENKLLGYLNSEAEDNNKIYQKPGAMRINEEK